MSDDFSSVEFAINPESRCAVVLLLDKSGSMGGSPISQLNDGLIAFADTIKSDPLASLRVEVAVVTFGGTVRVLDIRNGGVELDPSITDASQVFVSASEFMPPTLTASGDTPMGEATEVGLRLIRERKAIYKQNGIDYFRPWMFLMTDGGPTDKLRWPQSADAVKLEESRKGLSFYGVGTDTANMDILAKFSNAIPPVKLQGLMFKEMFVWLSKSLSSISNSKPGDQVTLPTVGWGVVDTGTK